MQKYSYLVSSDGELVALVDFTKSRDIIYSFNSIQEYINTNRNLNLLNAQNGKISNNKKFKDKVCFNYANEINPDEYLIF